MNGVKAAIFDMDGLMLDTERLGVEHFKRVAEEFGYPGIVDVYMRTVGRNGVDARRIFVEELGENFPFDQVRAKWRIYFDHHAASIGVPMKPGLDPLLGKLKDLGIRRAVATSNSRSAAMALLRTSDLLETFETVVCGDEISHGKPHPEIFLTAAQRLQVAPSECVVFEDSAAGIEGAYAAGMTPILVPDLIAPSPATRALAYQVVDTLGDCVTLFH